MRGSNPRQPTGSDAEAVYHQSMHERVHGAPAQFVDSSTVKWNRTTNGVSAHVRLPRGGSTTTTEVEAFNLTSMAGDYYTCTPVAGGTAIKIAKPYKLRNTVVAETIDGKAVTYAYGAYTGALNAIKAQFVRRDATVDGVTEKQDVIPRYILGDKIYAVKVSGGSGVTNADYIDLNVDGRAWAVRADQTT